MNFLLNLVMLNRRFAISGEGTAMALPNDTPIEKIAKELGAGDGEIKQLSARARKLTKGDLIALLGVEKAEDAAVAYALTAGGNLIPKPSVTRRTGTLTVQDRASIGRAFARPQKAAFERLVTPGEGIGKVGGIGPVADISCCCCCPCTCCCAATVMKPARVA